MKGDFSRNSLDPSKSYTRVMMQQGRVQLDSDWNEQASILLSATRSLTHDLLGRGAGPRDRCGFQIVAKRNAAAVASNVSQELKDYLGDHQQALDNGDLVLLPGRYYVEGIPVELSKPMLYSEQQGYPFDAETKIEKIKGLNPYTAYLEVWEDFVAPDQDDGIVEPALGGADSCGRAKIFWQVRVLGAPNTPASFDDLKPIGNGKLSAWTDASGGADTPCIIAPSAQYRGVENQLYRVEIHSGGGDAGVTFKWSRDNGSLVFPVRKIGGQSAELAHLGRDAWTTLTEDNWVEYIDDALIARDGAGLLAKVTAVDRDEHTVKLDWANGVPESADPDLHPLLRRWDHQGVASDGAIPVTAGDEVELEDGLIIRFEANGEFRAGNYWLIPARVPLAGIIWPRKGNLPVAKVADGPIRAYAPLARRTGNNLNDQRRLFDPLP